MQIKTDKIKKFILESGLISKADFSDAEKEAEKKDEYVGEILVSKGILKETELKRIEAYILGISFVSLIGEKIEKETLSLIPEAIAKKHNIIAYKKQDDILEVAMLDVDDLPTIDFIKKKVSLKIVPRLTDAESIKSALVQYQNSLEADFHSIIKKESVKLKTVKEDNDTIKSEKELKDMAEDLPIIKIVDTLISHAIVQGASDIHIEPGEEDLIVRYRIDGILHDAMTLPKNTAPGITARIKVLSNLKLDEKRLPQDGRFKIDNGGDNVSFRVSTLPTYFGEKTVMRILRENSKGYSLETLGFHGEGLESIHNGMKQRTGMILVAGPTGSGKTTTLYTILDILNTPDVNISTVEDPIEYQMTRINQTQVKPEIGLSFASGLRALLRQDPDIVMVGEIRDGETASLAINASLTGHLVLSTIHTNSASGAIPRLVDMGALPFLIISTVKTVVAQRLVRKLHGEKEKYFLSKDEIALMSKNFDLDRLLILLKKEKTIGEKETWETIPFYKPKESTDAPDGYRGRIGLHEVLVVTSSIKELILRGATEDEIEKQAKEEGMMSMLEDGIYQAVLGNTSIEEVFRVVSE